MGGTTRIRTNNSKPYIRPTILKTFYDPGHPVKAGDKIVELDQEETKSSFDKQVDQLELKRNEIKQLKYKLDKDLFDLKIIRFSKSNENYQPQSRS